MQILRSALIGALALTLAYGAGVSNMNGVGALLQSAGIDLTDADMVMQLLNQERSKTSGSTPTLESLRSVNHQDTTDLFISKDTLIAQPIMGDTLFYLSRQDTISTDSLSDTTIIEVISRFQKDKAIVRRRIPMPRKILNGPERYELSFFRTAPASAFGSTTNQVNGDYPLKAGDRLVLTLWGELEKEFKLVINNQGRVMIEGIGLNSLNGLTLGEAQEVLKQKFSGIYSGIKRNKIFVNLRLEGLSPIKIFLVGEVRKPGGYVFYGNTSIFQALYLAGGPNAIGSVRQIQVTRGDSTYKVDLYQYLMHGKKPSPSILNDGDIVYLPRAEILSEVQGDVGRPAIYELIGGESVKELLFYAGKVNATAATQRMVVQRIFENGKRDFVDLATPAEYDSGTVTFPMRDGDILQVNKSTEKAMDYVTIIGAVKYPATYQFKGDMTIPSLVDVAGGMLEESYLGRIQVVRPNPVGGSEMLSQAMTSKQSFPLKARDTVVVYSLRNMYTPDSVTISGAVLKPGRYVYSQGMTAKDLILNAGGFLANREKGKLRLEHVRKDSRGMEVEYVQIQDNYESDASDKHVLRPWDHLEVPVDPNFQRPQKVVLAGAFKSPGQYSLLQPGETVQSLVERSGGFQDDAYLVGARFFRLKDSIGEVGIDLKKAMKKDPLHNIELQHGDSLFVPVPSIEVKVMGEVGYPSNVLYIPGKKIAWYITKAGGFKATSDLNRVMIRYANGSVSTEFDAEREPDPGSIIIVPYKEPPPPVNWYQVATTFATIVGAAASILMAYAAILKADNP